MTRKLFLDCDGVLADFDGGVERLTGLSPHALQEERGVGGFWKALARADGFYEHLDPLPGAMEMVDRVAHLDPVILTGLPIGKWAEPQKRAWAKRHFPRLEVITCMARDKWRYGSPGDVLVDDREKQRASWEEQASGLFILHRSVEDSLDQLSEIFDL
ncbi:5' nucleotidase, NT5C type [Sphingomicrobium nitratireducens]|uniref:5' nucleotidase, NT5C type n=1 Tax=Sphingomicrobium nitratireducens TaxID=2964666 RepID=UPI00223EA69D